MAEETFARPVGDPFVKDHEARHEARPAATSARIPGVPILGSLLDLQRDPLELLMRGVGVDVAEYRFGPKAAFLLNHPDLIRKVFVDRPDDWDKRTANNKVFRLVFGNSLVTSDGDYWKRQRRI